MSATIDDAGPQNIVPKTKVSPATVPRERLSRGGAVAMLGVAVIVLSLLGFALFRPKEGLGAWGVIGFLAQLAAVALVVVGCGQAATGSGKVFAFALSGQNKLSLANLQMACWTILVLGTVLVAAEINVTGWFAAGPDYKGPLEFEIPGALLAAMGIAAFSTAAVPAILSLKSADDPAAAADVSGNALAAQRQATATGVAVDTVTITGKVVGNMAAADARLVNLIQGDEKANAGTVDLSKVQQLLITLALLLTYAGMMVNAIGQQHLFTALPSPGERMVELLAISHAGYLGYKAMPKSGTDGKPQ